MGSLLSFNPRTREGCDFRFAQTYFMFTAFQSTHPRGVRQSLTTRHTTPRFVSIHAPARGATAPPPRLAYRYDVSIHAPARGATCSISRRFLIYSVSIHAPARGATGVSYVYTDKHIVSIHAPARGATMISSSLTCRLLFQSTHPRGVRRHSMRPDAQYNWSFQSTHPRGVRLAQYDYSQHICRFNPRTREGCDVRTPSAINSDIRFQSTHPRGVRPFAAPIHLAPPMFQSTHPRGVRPAAWRFSDCSDVFQSTHPRGVRPLQFCNV